MTDCNIPAFPQVLCCNPDGTHAAPIDISPVYGGMSLRDYFAGQALASTEIAVVANDVIDWSTTEERLQKIAQLSYSIADAMLDAREAKS